MSKRKLVDGMLCRDAWDRVEPEGQYITFFPGAGADDVRLDITGEWVWDDSVEYCPHVKVWMPKGWRRNYPLTPPKPGEAFEVDIEL